MLEKLSDGTKIRLTSDFPPQERQLLPLDLVRQRQVKGESKCVMHNGMSYSHSITVFLSFPFFHITFLDMIAYI